MYKYLFLLVFIYSSNAFSQFEHTDGDVPTFGEREFDERLVIKSQDELVGAIKPPGIDSLRLLKLDNAPQGFDVYIDPDSISVGEFDGIVRYWLVLKTDSGSYNADYEGMHCHRQEYQVYAYSDPRGKVRKLNSGKWRDIHGGGGSDYHLELKNDYLCSGARVRTMEEITELLSDDNDHLIPAYLEFTDI